MDFLDPDVLEIIDDPDVGGGVAFTVIRTKLTRTKSSVTKGTTEIHATGAIQPVTKTATPGDAEDILNEQIVIYTTCILQAGGKMNGGNYAADEILYRGLRWRVNSVDNWAEWGFTVGHATRMRE